jgi:hypothetical protein
MAMLNNQMVIVEPTISSSAQCTCWMLLETESLTNNREGQSHSATPTGITGWESWAKDGQRVLWWNGSSTFKNIQVSYCTILHIYCTSRASQSPLTTENRGSRFCRMRIENFKSLSWASLGFSHLARHLKVLIETLGTSPQDTTGHRMICQPSHCYFNEKHLNSKPLRNDIEQKRAWSFGAAIYFWDVIRYSARHCTACV